MLTDDNVDKAASDKIGKQKYLCQEHQKLYRLDHILVYPVVISSNGLIPNDTIRSAEKLKVPEKLLGQKAVHNAANIQQFEKKTKKTYWLRNLKFKYIKRLYIYTLKFYLRPFNHKGCHYKPEDGLNTITPIAVVHLLNEKEDLGFTKKI